MLSRNRLLNILAGIIFAISVLHAVAMAFSLYWQWWWYDLTVHFLGGAFAALLIAWFFFFSGYTTLRLPNQSRLLWFAILGVLAIGGGWELFERLLGHSWSPEGYWLDTGIDIVMDVLGGLGAYVLFLKDSGKDGKNEDGEESIL